MTSTARALLGSLDQPLHLIDQLEAAATSFTRDAELNLLRITLTVSRLADADGEKLLALATDGHFVSITANDGSWAGTVQAEGPTAALVSSDGVAEDALNAADAEQWQLAERNGDPDGALAAIGSLPATIRIHLRNQPDDTTCHWIPTIADLGTCLTGPNWASTLRTLSQTSSTLVVSDAGSTAIRGAHLTICGPDAAGQPPLPLCEPAPEHHDARPALPTPELLTALPTPRPTAATSSDSWDTVWAAAQSCTRLLVWFHLASTASLADGAVALRLDGARVVDLHLRPRADTTDASADVALYRWAFSTPDPGRLEAVLRAATLAIVDPSADLGTAAAPALRTAQSLYELTRRAAVAEALASRRTARESAVASARAAATAARDVASKAADRALVQSAAAVAVVLTNVARLIGDRIAITLLVLIAVVLAGNLYIARQQELPSAHEGLAFDLQDLDQYREALSAADIDNIRTLKTVSAARNIIATTRRTVTAVYGATIVAVLAVGIPIIFLSQPAHTGTPKPGSVPSTPAISPTSAPTTARPGSNPATTTSGQ